MQTRTLPKPLTASKQASLFEDNPAFNVPLDRFPKTRYQGSKRRLLSELVAVFSPLKPTKAIDLYSGTATVSLLLRMMGWQVTANDFLSFNNATARLLLGRKIKGLSVQKIRADLTFLLHDASLNSKPLVSIHFAGIYFPDEENLEIDRFCQNIGTLASEFRDLYIYCVGQALLMKRPYNLFHRANLNMRTRTVERSFGNVATWNTPTLEHAVKIAANILAIPDMGDNQLGFATQQNTLELKNLPDLVDLVYLDPPYLNAAGQGVDYCSFYHFLDGLCDYNQFAAFNGRYPHRPIVENASAWMTEKGGLDELTRILRKWTRSTIVLSYRSDGRPSFESISRVFKSEGREFQTTDAHNFKYALSKKLDTKEMFLISAPN